MAIDFASMMKQAELEMKQKLSMEGKSREDEIVIDSTTLPSRKLVDYEIESAHKKCFYIPEFLSVEEEERLVNFFKNDKWIQLRDRKLKNYGGAPHLSGTILEPLPQPLQQLGDKLVKFEVFESPPDQALVNHYSSSGGIGYHQDGPNFKPKAAIVSLLSSCLIRFKLKDGTDLQPILLEPRSLFIFSDELYTVHKHGILCTDTDFEEASNIINKPDLKNLKIDRAERISVTLRNVSKVMYTMSSLSEVLPPHLQEERERRLAWWSKAVNEAK